nr:MAG TPA: hypothetical protein [Caudoviricetes sp.]
MKFTRNHAMICLSVLSVALFCRYTYFAGIMEGTKKANRKAVNSAHDYLQNIYHDRVKTLLDTCVDSGMTESTFERICDLMDCPL